MNALKKGEPVAFLHHDIGQDQLKTVLINCFQGFLSARCHRDVVSLTLKGS